MANQLPDGPTEPTEPILTRKLKLKTIKFATQIIGLGLTEYGVGLYYFGKSPREAVIEAGLFMLILTGVALQNFWSAGSDVNVITLARETIQDIFQRKGDSGRPPKGD
jgi:hypothetical protein